MSLISFGLNYVSATVWKVHVQGSCGRLRKHSLLSSSEGGGPRFLRKEDGLGGGGGGRFVDMVVQRCSCPSASEMRAMGEKCMGRCMSCATVLPETMRRRRKTRDGASKIEDQRRYARTRVRNSRTRSRDKRPETGNLLSFLQIA